MQRLHVCLCRPGSHCLWPEQCPSSPTTGKRPWKITCSSRLCSLPVLARHRMRTCALTSGNYHT